MFLFSGFSFFFHQLIVLTTFAERSAVGLDCRKKTSETGSSGVMLTLKISFLLSADALMYYFNSRFRYRGAVSLGATFDCRKQPSETRSAGSRATKPSIIEVQVVIWCLGLVSFTFDCSLEQLWHSPLGALFSLVPKGRLSSAQHFNNQPTFITFTWVRIFSACFISNLFQKYSTFTKSIQTVIGRREKFKSQIQFSFKNVGPIKRYTRK